MMAPDGSEGAKRRLCYVVSPPVTISNIGRCYILLQIQGDSVVSDTKVLYSAPIFYGSKWKHEEKREEVNVKVY